ncbi:benzoate 4-monooxygenase cytochrome P450 [Stachybotrys elegans]|uniref:Benzoate 4-monooxygenase cytochrome P450 n=1 Tax=Stachybotrys elegans TaxID=80388 RepID=A0A8K0SPN1_9HYPO|nr:benzoate 4-monooxygenase cytochrome P450 [Stachybotrys elegans]
MAAYLALSFLAGVAVYQAIFIHNDLIPLGLQTLGYGLAYHTGLFCSILTYRLFFYPLCQFPGPRLAAVSKLWHVWKCRSSLGHLVLEEWRQQYGPFVRTGPNELTLFHPGAVELMDNPKSTRSDWYNLIHPRASSIFTRSKAVHSARRKIWDQALSQASLVEYYRRFKNQIRNLDVCLADRNGAPVYVNELMYWYAFDNMGDFGFGKDFGMVREQRWVDGALMMRSALTLLGPFSPAIWIPRLGFALVPNLGKVKHWFKMLDFADDCTYARMKAESPNPDVSDYFIKEFLAGPQDQHNRRLLSGDIATMVVAGSDTTAPSLTILLYHLARYPEQAAKVLKELSTVSDTADARVLATLPELQAFINESQRLLPAILSFGSRITPPEGLSLDGTFVPGGVKISAPRYSLGRLPDAYVKPDEFIAERWTTRPDLIKDKRSFSPFGTGRMSCVGKNLAMAQLRLVAALVLTKYKLNFAGFYYNLSLSISKKL